MSRLPTLWACADEETDNRQIDRAVFEPARINVYRRNVPKETRGSTRSGRCEAVRLVDKGENGRTGRQENRAVRVQTRSESICATKFLLAKAETSIVLYLCRAASSSTIFRPPVNCSTRCTTLSTPTRSRASSNSTRPHLSRALRQHSPDSSSRSRLSCARTCLLLREILGAKNSTRS